MTFCKKLAERVLPNGDTVTAWEMWDKGCAAARYEVEVARKNSPVVGYGDVYPCARTTWRRKLREVAQEVAGE